MEWLQYIFGYSLDPKEAFFFNRFDFWIFFLVIFGVYSLLYKRTRIRNIYITLFSLFFYYKSGGFYFFLLLFSTVADYHLGNWIYRATTKQRKLFWVTVSIVINLGLLCYYKYSEFIVENINAVFGTHFHAVDFMALLANDLTGSHFNVETLILPIGISFYVFQTISYTVDIYRGRLKPVNDVLDFAFFVCFFPHLVAGPIVRASQFVHQIYEPYKVTRDDVGRALFLIIAGLTKKILIADYLGANLVNAVFEDPEKYSGFHNLTAVYGFALQIYGDFSGYSDIAIGIALLLGFRLPLNFNSPYKAVSTTDFWRRWHISLSTWLRDYLYIPLGGNRKGNFNTYKNLMITMLLGGLWHGADWKFVIWGGLHGAGLAIHKLWRTVIPSKENPSMLSRLFWGFITFQFVCLCWIFFRAESYEEALFIIGRIFGNFIPASDVMTRGELFWEMIVTYKGVFVVLLTGFFIHLMPESWKMRAESTLTVLPVPVQAAVLACVGLGLYQVMSAELQPFIYFQF